MPAPKSKAAPAVSRARNPVSPKQHPTIAEAIEEAGGLDWLCDRIEAGDFQGTIARDLGFAPSRLSEWMAADAERLTRVAVARRLAAATFADKALRVLEDARSSPVEITRAREIASHYRWMAKMHDPGSYGEKTQIDLNAKVEHASVAQVDEELSKILGKAAGG